jgi:hypothetical protein
MDGRAEPHRRRAHHRLLITSSQLTPVLDTQTRPHAIGGGPSPLLLQLLTKLSPLDRCLVDRCCQVGRKARCAALYIGVC